MRGRPAGGACAPVADVRSVPPADPADNSWTLDLDIAVLRLKTTLAARGTLRR
ncbi:hypothetical protein AB0O51_13485 [Streptomyces sp. NPDC090301]|uniref:hypothetical protein n=1 Tax=Streptomyces sp. NPDC090301 TaxID=3154975 RepID=UPI003449612E